MQLLLMQSKSVQDRDVGLAPVIRWTIPVPPEQRGLIREWRRIGDENDPLCWIGLTDDSTNSYSVKPSQAQPGRWNWNHNITAMGSEATAERARERCEGHAKGRAGK